MGKVGRRIAQEPAEGADFGPNRRRAQAGRRRFSIRRAPLAQGEGRIASRCGHTTHPRRNLRDDQGRAAARRSGLHHQHALPVLNWLMTGRVWLAMAGAPAKASQMGRSRRPERETGWEERRRGAHGENGDDARLQEAPNHLHLLGGDDEPQAGHHSSRSHDEGSRRASLKLWAAGVATTSSALRPW